VIDARFGHVNVIARNWRTLASFYTELFGCELVPPERDYSGADLERGTGVAGAALRGAHLRLPGHGPDGPTLEIYQFSSMPEAFPPAVNRPGFQHIAFAVPSVADARAAVLGSGGGVIGEVVTLETADGRSSPGRTSPIRRATSWSSSPGRTSHRDSEDHDAAGSWTLGSSESPEDVSRAKRKAREGARPGGEC
jgi:catechol 2,3-dioxygenase-like lactoylglutathione lyase family enzyme